MTFMRFFALFPCVLLLFGLDVFSADSTFRSGKTKWQVLPTFFYTPQTHAGMGGVFLQYFEPADSNTKPSSSQWYLSGTLNKQFRFESDFNVFFNENSYYLRGKHELAVFPEFFFGVGNNTDPSDACLINYRIFDFSAQGYRMLSKDVYMGLALHHQSLNDIMKVDVKSPAFTYSDYQSTGVGLEFLWDKRDYILNPHEGHFIEFGAAKYLGTNGNPGDFIQTFLDVRVYKTFAGKWVTNWNWYQEHNWGNVPFRMMPVLGGPHFLRGFYKGRFRDNNLHVFQAECRRNLFWRIGMAAFAGIGQAFMKNEDFRINRYHYSYGGGLRIRLDEESKATIRIDYGRTQDSQGMYIVYAEAF
jgi:hypothetical protein